LTVRVRAILLVLALLFVASVARADARRVAVVGNDPALKKAMSVALSPWSIHVVAVDSPTPASSLPRAAHEANAVAHRFDAAGVVWITTTDGEAALWAYDAATEQVVSRPLASSPPFDAPTAAAAALTVKTLLRSSTVAPPEERLGAEVTRKSDAIESSPAHEAPGAAEATVAERKPRSHAQLEMGGAARALAGDVDARLALGGAIFFGTVGVGMSFRFGPGLGVDEARFRGRFDEIGVAPSFRLKLALGGPLTLEPRASGTVHFTRIDGIVLPAGTTGTATRADLSFDLGTALDVALSPAARIGLEIEASYVLRYQRYLVVGERVLSLAPLQGSAGLRLVTRFP
jgi:hypothetical protein